MNHTYESHTWIIHMNHSKYETWENDSYKLKFIKLWRKSVIEEQQIRESVMQIERRKSEKGAEVYCK